MARLYNGFNGLMLGQAINDLYDGIAQQRASGLQSIGNSLQDYFTQRGIEQKEQQRKQDAIDFLMGRGGMDEASARQFAGTVDPSEAVRYMQGRLDKKADTADDRAYEQSIYDRNRNDQIEDKVLDRAYAWQDWLRKHDIESKDSIAASEFSDISNRIAMLQQKAQSGSLPSQIDIDEMRSLKKKRNEWLKLHPNYSQIYYTDWMDNDQGEDGNDPLESKEATIAAMKAMEKNGFVSPKDLNDFNNRFLWRTGHNLYNDPEYKDLYKNLASKQKGKKIVRNAANPDAAGITTQEDLQRILDNSIEQQRLRNIHGKLVSELMKGAPVSDISDADLSLLEMLEKNGKIKKGAVTLYRNRKKRGS